MVLDNLGAALRVSAVLYSIQAAIGFYFLSQFNFAMDVEATGEIAMPSGNFWLVWLVFMGVTIVTSLWIAVGWHRYVLLDELPSGFLPTFHSGEIGAYFKTSILLGLLMMLVGMVLGALLLPIVFSVISVSSGLGSLIAMTAFAGAPLMWMFYRLSLTLPAAALGQPSSFGESWAATSGASGVIFQLVVIGVLVAIMVNLPSQMNPDPSSLVNIIYSLVVNWMITMGGVSVLSTLYGVYIERREL